MLGMNRTFCTFRSLDICKMDPQNDFTVYEYINVDFKIANIAKEVKCHWPIMIVCSKFEIDYVFACSLTSEQQLF